MCVRRRKTLLENGEVRTSLKSDRSEAVWLFTDLSRRTRAYCALRESNRVRKKSRHEFALWVLMNPQRAVFPNPINYTHLDEKVATSPDIKHRL